MSMFNTVLAQVLRIEIALQHACFRLQAKIDDEALHDLRIQLRRLRSLLLPLRKIRAAERLDSAAARLGKLTTPVRDVEVLVGELARAGHYELAAVRRETLKEAYGRILRSRALARLFAELDEWPDLFRLDWMEGNTRKLRKRVAKKLARQISRLSRALDEPEYDRHKLRILAKHTRYLLEAYPRQASVVPEVICTLRAVLSTLGTWHDRFQWCLKAEIELDLQPLLLGWRQAAASTRRDAEVAITRLRHLLEA